MYGAELIDRDSQRRATASGYTDGRFEFNTIVNTIALSDL